MAEKKAPKKTYVLPAGIAAHPHIAAPDKKGQFADDKYKVTIVWDADVDLSKIRAEIVAQAKEKFGSKFDEESFHFPWRVRDENDPKEDFRNKITCVIKSDFKPDVVDAKKQPVPVASIKGTGKDGEVYTKMRGDRVKAMATLYLYAKTEKVKDGKKLVDVETLGCSLQLCAIQIIEKRSGGNYAAGFDEEDGYSSAGSDAAADGDPGASREDGDGPSNGDF
jgi:hypothetical protein